MNITVSADGVDYAVQTITAGKALEIQERFAGNSTDPRMTASIVAASIGKTLEEALDLPWPHYTKLVDASLEVNGLKPTKADASGEAQAGASPAA